MHKYRYTRDAVDNNRKHGPSFCMSSFGHEPSRPFCLISYFGYSNKIHLHDWKWCLHMVYWHRPCPKFSQDNLILGTFMLCTQMAPQHIKQKKMILYFLYSFCHIVRSSDTESQDWSFLIFSGEYYRLNRKELGNMNVSLVSNRCKYAWVCGMWFICILITWSITALGLGKMGKVHISFFFYESSCVIWLKSSVFGE